MRVYFSPPQINLEHVDNEEIATYSKYHKKAKNPYIVKVFYTNLTLFIDLK